MMTKEYFVTNALESHGDNNTDKMFVIAEIIFKRRFHGESFAVQFELSCA